MISVEHVTARISGLAGPDLARWIENGWVRPDGVPGAYRFQEIDIARLRLILQLRDDMGLDEGAMPVVLNLLDQLYETRRQMRRLCTVMDGMLPDETRRRLLNEIDNLQ